MVLDSGQYHDLGGIWEACDTGIGGREARGAPDVLQHTRLPRREERVSRSVMSDALQPCGL